MVVVPTDDEPAGSEALSVVVLKLPQPDGESGTRAVGIIVEEGVDES